MCQIKMAPLHPRFQFLLSPLSKITVIQIIFFKKKKPFQMKRGFCHLYICYLQVFTLMRTFEKKFKAQFTRSSVS